MIHTFKKKRIQIERETEWEKKEEKKECDLNGSILAFEILSFLFECFQRSLCTVIYGVDEKKKNAERTREKLNK